VLLGERKKRMQEVEGIEGFRKEDYQQ